MRASRLFGDEPRQRGGPWRDCKGLVAALLAMMICCAALQGTAAERGFARLVGHGGPVKGIAVSVDGSHALTTSFDYTLGLWDLRTDGHVRWLNGHDAAVNAAAFLAGGDKALSVGDDFSLILWDLRTGAVLKRMEGHQGKLIAVATDAQQRRAVTSGWDGRAGIWDLTADNPPIWLDGHKGAVNDAVFAEDGTSVYTASYDGTIRRWNARTGRLEHTLAKHGFGINRLVLDTSSGWLAYGAVDGAVRVIDLATDAPLADLTADRRPILALAASPDRTRLAVGDGEGYIMVIDTATWRIERDFHAAARGPIWALAWTADGQRLLSGGIDDAAVLWPMTGDTAAPDPQLASTERSFLRPPEEMSNGERQFARKCSICHTLQPDGAHRAGPSLWGLFGRRAGQVAGYAYSPALSGATIVWEADTIDRLFDDGPEHFTPGSKMPMQRIAKAQDRLDLIEYLSSNTGPRTVPGNGPAPGPAPRSVPQREEKP